jgi:integrase
VALTALKIRSLGPGRHADGHGLYLFVKDSGSRSWVLRMQREGRRRDFGLGSAHDVSLAEAREAASLMRKQVRSGGDPVAAKASRRVRIPTFEAAANQCYESLRAGWKNKRHESWLSSLTNHIFPMIGKTPIDAVDSALVCEALGPIWLEIPETANRILQRIGAVLDYAHIKGWRKEETSLRSVRKGLPRQVKPVEHLASMPWSDVPDFAATLAAASPTVGRDALRFTIYTVVRSNETRFATWPEFDLERGVWSIPAERMKAGEAHSVPLSQSAIAILRRLWNARTSDDGLVFSANGTKPISDMTMTKLIRDMGLADITVHGFRSSFTDWVAEQTDFAKEVADKALAHKLPNRVEAAYRRTDFFEKRRELMAAWAMFVDSGIVDQAAASGR